MKDKLRKDYEVSGRPTYYLIDPKGKIICLSRGDLQKIETAIKKELRDEKKL